MTEEATRLKVWRQGQFLGDYYLSFVELGLTDGTFLPSDVSKVEDESEELSLANVVAAARLKEGKKRLATSAQRRYLRRCHVEPWRGISNREASALISALIGDYDIPPGGWIEDPMTDEQRQILVGLGVVVERGWTKGQASRAISKALE